MKIANIEAFGGKRTLHARVRPRYKLLSLLAVCIAIMSSCLVGAQDKENINNFRNVEPSIEK